MKSFRVRAGFAALSSFFWGMTTAFAAPANVALNKTVTASSTYPAAANCPDCYGPKNAVDANAATWSRWTAKDKASASAPQYIDVDLGKDYLVSSFVLGTGKENAYGKLVDFQLQARTSSVSALQTVATVAANTVASRTVSVTPVTARYVRVLCTKVADDQLCRIYDLKVMGDAVANRAPVANAGADVSITLPTASVSLSGSGTDPDGNALTYAWSKVSGGAATIASPAAAKTAISGLVAGAYVFRLTVKDSGGLSASDDVAVTVKAAPANQAPKALAGADVTITLPTNSVSLSGSGTDADGAIASYAWSKVSGGAATIASPAAAKTAISALVAGAYVFRLTVKDNQGASAYDDVAVTVKPAAAPPANQAPKALAGADVTITLPTNSVSLSGSGTDADGSIASYAWSKVSGGAATIASPAAAKTAISALVAGAYVFRLTVKDNQGASAYDDVAVTVKAAPATGTDPQAGKIQVWKRSPASGAYVYDAAVYLPKDYVANGSKKYPLVISLHGKGGSTLTSDHSAVNSNPEGFLRQLIPSKALASTFTGIVVAPHGYCVGCKAETWWDVKGVHDLVMEAIGKYAVDPDRIVVTGLSAGGDGTNGQLMNYRDLYAGFMPLSYFPPKPAQPCDLDDTPIWAGGNEGDGTFDAWDWFVSATSLYKTVTKCAGYTGQFKVTIRAGQNTHSGWDEIYATPEVQQWLVNQHRK